MNRRTKVSVAAMGVLVVVIAWLVVATPTRSLTPNVGEHIHVEVVDHPVDGFPIPRVATTYQVNVRAHDTTGPIEWLRLCDGSSHCFDRVFFTLGPCADCSKTIAFRADWTKWAAGRHELRWTANINSNSDGERQFNTSRANVCIGSCSPNIDGRATPYNGGGSWYLDHYAVVVTSSRDTSFKPGGTITHRATNEAKRSCAFLKPDFHNLSSGTKLGCIAGTGTRTVTIPSSAQPGDALVLFADEPNGHAGLIKILLGNGSARAKTTYEFQSWWAEGGIVLP